jgi:hypothetical protein
MSDAIKEQMHELLDRVPEKALPVLLSVLRHLASSGDAPLVTAEEAPFDDEPLTAEDLRAIEQSEKDFEEGNFMSQEEVRRKLGL